MFDFLASYFSCIVEKVGRGDKLETKVLDMVEVDRYEGASHTFFGMYETS